MWCQQQSNEQCNPQAELEEGRKRISNAATTATDDQGATISDSIMAERLAVKRDAVKLETTADGLPTQTRAFKKPRQRDPS